ncbi:hypothetical protein BCV71DRAFT_183019 [Rhizopus microsporus]|uniref:Uncharacterized protein n=1 Tax=Rhizopus microsporus TaxID=58291 RepID=A0A1X0RXF8_RHIZD|nr:hypothetical protein BCV71DRAFT_183019 [Rhizopus microsporus]
MSFNDLTTADDNLLFDEIHYARYGYERTSEEFPSTRLDKLPEPPSAEYAQFLSKPIRHFIAASSSEITAFISRDGYWNCLNISLGLEAGRTEVIAIDCVEEKTGDEIKTLLALAIAEVCIDGQVCISLLTEIDS